MNNYRNDEFYMQEAINLAANGLGRVSPNPPVGCVIVNNGQIVGRGWHQVYGGLHAEPNAINDAASATRGATAYVTLMPCNHHGKTPPCTKALVEAGITRVVVAVDDPNSESGDGRNMLIDHGISVDVGILAEQAQWVMHGFLKYISSGLPHLHLKYAMTLDGKIATKSGDSKWISSETSRCLVQDLRRKSDAVMVGSNTACADNPSLNVREGDTTKQPLRVIIDSQLKCAEKLTPESALFSAQGDKSVFLTNLDENCESAKKLSAYGAEIMTIGTTATGHINLTKGLSLLAHKYGVRNILCEGGGGLAGALLHEGLVDEISAFICPKILGGSGISPCEGPSPQLMSSARDLSNVNYREINGDLLFNGRITNSLSSS